MSSYESSRCFKLNTGHNIPLIGVGTYQITGPEAVRTTIDAAQAAGNRHIDTAKVYTNEKDIGNALKELMPKYNLHRSDIYITTKVFLNSEDSKKATREAVEESLQLLHIDFLDLVLVHYPRPSKVPSDNPANPALRRDCYQELEKLKDEGKIRSIGVLNYEIGRLEELNKYARIPPSVNQCECHPHFTRLPLRQYCHSNNIFFQAFSSLGKQNPKLIQDPVIAQIAQHHNTSVNLVLLAWALAQDIGILPKSQTPSRIKENFESTKVKLTDDEVQQISSLNCEQPYTMCDPWNIL
uniref:NADP-dependent oxidoreductase domain-containing protein n=1 Tax=Plectus sambesii TaxID=2011161 RepID=A0A914W1T9_9BILA